MASPNVKFYDVRSYEDWNRIQDRIERGNEWAITYIHRFGHEDEHWEAWGKGKRLDSRCATLQDAQDVISDAISRPGSYGLN